MTQDHAKISIFVKSLFYKTKYLKNLQMKNIHILLMLCFIGLLNFVSTAQSNTFSVNGKASEITAGQKIFLEYKSIEKKIKDSVTVENGTFSISGTIDIPTKATLFFVQQDGSKSSVDFYVEPNQNTSVQFDTQLESATIQGGTIQSDYVKYNDLMADHNSKENALMSEFMALRTNKDEEGMKKWESKYEDLDHDKKQLIKKFIQQNPSSHISFVSLENISYVVDQNFIDMFELLSDDTKKSVKAEKLVTQITKSKKTFVGQKAMDFTQKDTSENDVTLASLRGKYVLIDFWASWCGPCRRENPNIVKAYHAYKDKNFTILGVSLDSKKDAWIKAIQKDDLPWFHVSDLKGWNNEVSDMYGIRSIPQNLLLDPNGMIIEKNIKGSELGMVLAKYLKVN